MKTPALSPTDFLAELGDERGQRLFDALADIRFFTKDARGIYQHASRVMQLAHGFADSAEIAGLTDHDFIPAYLADHYTSDDRQVLAGAEIWGRVELVMRHPGCADWYVTTKIPLRTRDGRIVGLAGVSRDLRLTASMATPFTRFAAVLDHVREQFAEPIEIDLLARMAGMSARTFQRRFKETFHVTPTEYVRQFRIGHACQMLIETDATISTIALSTGFSDHSHLTREFTRAMKLTPGAYRKRYRPG